MSDRIPCLVLGCRRTAPASRYSEGTRIICGKCWRLSSKHDRRRIRRVERIIRRLGFDLATVTYGHTEPGSKGRRALVLHTQLFDRIAKQATEAKVGIG
jgi:hypothetical protein